ncbi:MAG: hypothetical protein HC897_10280 [Thermoanaerobaculia bacterium]|nr:hypothetical protein [Thermoanaerobaculia bacterium]
MRYLRILAIAFFVPLAAHAAELPSGEQWLVHFVRDVLPYWSSPEALGRPIGHFPTFRYTDGTPIAAGERIRPEYPWLTPENAPWIALRLDRTYTRMLSRQAYVLGVAYHLTGDGRYLAWAKAAVDHILRDLADGEGSFCSWIEDGACRPAPRRRTAQDFAYALLGPAFYAYLTHDPEVLSSIVAAQKAFFAAYRDPQTGLLRWVLEASEDPPDTFSPEQVELVAQLDQVNAYLLLLAPVVPETERWQAELVGLSKLLMERFYDPEHNVFWGRIDAPEFRRMGGHHHTDVGHTTKTFWMLDRIAALTGDQAMAKLAREGGLRLIDGVFREKDGAWSDGWNADGTIKDGATWWAFAEVDQLAATLALTEPRAASHLPRTYDFWLTRFVDHRQGGVWPFPIDPADQPPVLKAHLWKNGYHEAEHALVAYLTGNALRGEPVELYFAPAVGETIAVRPYFFQGEAEPLGRLPWRTCQGESGWRFGFAICGR